MKPGHATLALLIVALCADVAMAFAPLQPPGQQARDLTPEQRLKPCGTVLTEEDIARELELQAMGFWDRPPEIPNRSTGQLVPFVGMIIHVIRHSDGSDGVDIDLMNAAVAEFNSKMAFTGHDFYIFDVRWIDDDQLIPTTTGDFATLCIAFGTPGYIDVFFTPELVDYCGLGTFPSYNYHGVIVANDCLSYNDLLSHEVGHYLWLFHTHETAFGTECCNGLNCSTAGDLLCDTPADPNLYWENGNVDNTCTYIGNEFSLCSYPPEACFYDPLVENIMSYSGYCTESFTYNQRDRMVNTLSNVGNRADHVWYTQDCNFNGRPDPLDIEWGFSSDSDGDGIPDECESPLNDDCETALVVTEGSYTFSTYAATTTNPQVWCPFEPINHDLWYRWMAPSCGTLSVSMCDAVNFTSAAVIWEGDCGNLHDQDCDLATPNDSCSGGAVESVHVEAGRVYTIMIGGLDGDSGTGTMTIDFTPQGGLTVTVPSAYPTIQEALDAHPCEVEILVASGTYTVDGDAIIMLDRDSDVVISAMNSNPANTVLDCEAVRRCMISTGEGHVTLKGFTIRNGFAQEGDDYLGRGGAIWKTYGGLTIDNCRFESNTAEGIGGAIFSLFSHTVVTNSVFAENTSPFAGAIYMDNINSASNLITDTHFMNNSSEYGGAIYFYSTHAVVKNCIFLDNEANVAGGGVRARYGQIYFDTCYFQSNTAPAGGGLWTGENQGAVINCWFDSNTASDLGGGVYINSSDWSFADCTISGNTAGSGGGIRCYDCSPTITDCTISGNISTNASGGGMRNTLSSPHLTNCTFLDNSSTTYNAGAMANFSESHPVVIQCTFDGNTALGYGGAVHNYNASNPVFHECLFKNNQSDLGAAVSNYVDNDPVFSSCTFENNVAGTNAGAVYSYLSIGSYEDCTFDGNTSNYDGAAVRNDRSSPTFVNCQFMNNISGDQAGAMANYTLSNANVTGCTFEGNRALTTGGAINNWDYSNPSFSQCVFRQNTSEWGGAVSNYTNANATFSECLFEYNEAGTEGGALWSNESCFPSVGDSDFTCNPPQDISGNWVDDGGNLFEECCPGDLDLDGDSDIDDLLILLGDFGQADSPADLDGDGLVDVDDLLTLLGHFGLC